MKNTLTPTRSFVSALAAASLLLTGILGSAMPAQASKSNTIVANETVVSKELVKDKTLVVTGFLPNSTSLTASMKKRIEKFIADNPDFDFVRCQGFADRSGSPATNRRLGVERATSGCAIAVKANPEVEVSLQVGKWDRQFSGANIRRLSITLSNFATASITTTYNANGGAQGITKKKETAGTPKILPTPTREGYVFSGWFTEQFAGTYVGAAGESYIPNRSQTLWAQWFTPSSASSGSSTPTVSINFSLGIDHDLIAEEGIRQHGIDSSQTVQWYIDRDTAEAVEIYCSLVGPRSVEVSYFVGAARGQAVSLGTAIIPPCSANRPGSVRFTGDLENVERGSLITVIVSYDVEATPSGDWVPGADGFEFEIESTGRSNRLSFDGIFMAG